MNDVFVWVSIILAAIVLARFKLAVTPDVALDRLARLLDQPRTYHPPHQAVIEGDYRGERVRLTRTSGSPGTLCQVDCSLARALWATLCAGVTPGAPPRVVGGATPTSPAAFTSSEAARPLRTLLQHCSFVRVREPGVDARFEDERAASAVLEALVGLVRALRAAGPMLEGVPVDLHERTQVSVGCPYCRGPLGDREPIACRRCGTVHHLECFLEHGRCTVLACGGDPVSRVGERA